MKHIFVFYCLSIFIIGCVSKYSKYYCSSCKKIIKSVDTTMPYYVESKYCIYKVCDTILENETGLIRFNAFDRLNGLRMLDGPTIVYFVALDRMKDKFKCITEDGSGYKKLKQGYYFITVQSVHFSLRTKTIKVLRNKVIEINFYLGNSLRI